VPTAGERSDWPWDEQAFGPSARLRRTIRVEVDTEGLTRPDPNRLSGPRKAGKQLWLSGGKRLAPSPAPPPTRPRNPTSQPPAAHDPQPSEDDIRTAWTARGREGAAVIRELFKEPWNLRGHDVHVSVDDLTYWDTPVELDIHLSTEAEVTTADSLTLANDALGEAEKIMRRAISQAPVKLRVRDRSVARFEARLPHRLAESLRGPLLATLDLPSSDWAEMRDGRLRLCSPSSKGIPRVLAFLGDEERARRALESARPPASTAGLAASELRSRFNCSRSP
jgi:hypothetical protein